MPTYEYVCTTCQAPLEVVQSIHEPSLTNCPSCPEGRLRKIFGNVGVVFKGSGFYRTDSREKSKASAKAESKAQSKTDSKGEGTSESAKSGAKADSGSASSGDSASGSSGKAAAAASKPAGSAASATS
jgi:putative FmdB family regulatory protein